MQQLFLLLILVFTFQNCQSPTTEKESKQPESTPLEDSINKTADDLKDTLITSVKDTVTVAPLPVNPKPVPDKKDEQNIPQSANFDTTQWVEVTDLDASILLDLRYATTDNFMEEKVYECGRCFLRPAVAKAIVKAHQNLQKQGMGLKMFDCYRPRPIQWKLWNKVPNPKYVADPRKGSMHNRGAAIDLTIVDENGEQLDMGTKYDYFGKEGWTFYKDLPEEVLNNRKLLRETLAKVGLKHIKTEWWHFAYRSKRYAISDFVWACE